MNISEIIVISITTGTIAFVCYAIGYSKGYSAGLDYGSKALKEFSDHVTASIRSIGNPR